MADEVRPEVKSAILRGAFAETVLLAAGVLIWYVTGEFWGLVAAIVAGPAVMIFLLAQAGAFEKRQ